MKNEIILQFFIWLLIRLGRMRQSGLVEKWYNDEVAKLQKNEQGQGGGTNVGQERVTSKPLALDHLQVQFFNKFLTNIPCQHYYNLHFIAHTYRYVVIHLSPSPSSDT